MTDRVLRWARVNLIGSVTSTILTVVFVPLTIWAIYRLVLFVFRDAQWLIIQKNLQLLLVYSFPQDQIWRLWTTVFLFAIVFGAAAGAMRTRRLAQISEGRARPLGRHLFLRRMAPLALAALVLLWFARSWTAVLYVVALAAVVVVTRWLGQRIPLAYTQWPIYASFVVPVAGFLLLSFGRPWGEWGGFLMTVTLAVLGIALSFPVGVLLALGRRSSLPVIRYFCIGYIEVIRGVPLVALIFLGAYVINLVFPPNFPELDYPTRAVFAFVLFTSAYIAEIVRGGIQSVPLGQTEAAAALGLSHVRITGLIVLPQALRAVIPALVGQFISLFKDTSLIYIIGVSELLHVVQAIDKQPEFTGQGLLFETLLFAAFLYWVGSYTMSRESQRLERRLGVGER